ncbi:MAG: FUSC family protein [Desulfovibrionaceae bacterium]|nr:FUSC family protein [Desulfovibrionaceae bacterium]
MKALSENTWAQLRHGVKVGLASVLAYVVAYLIGIPYGYWAVITTVIVMQVHVADSLRMGVYRFTGTALGAGMGIVMILLLPPTPLYTLIGIFVGTGVCAYMTRYNAKFRMAAITVSIVFLTSLGEEGRIGFTLFRVAEIGIGVLSAVLVSVLVWPSRAGEKLRARLKKQYDALADSYELILNHFLDRQKMADPDLLFDLEKDIRKNVDVFHSVYAMERRLFRDDVALLSLQVTVLRSALERVQGMLILLNDLNGDGFDIIMTPELRELCRVSTDALRALGSGAPHDRHGLAAAVVASEERFYELRRQGVTGRFDVRRLFQVLGFINAAQHLGEYLLDALNNPEMSREG